MFNPSFCQETVMRAGGRGRAVFPWGTNDLLVGGTNEVLVGDKRDPRRGQTATPWGTAVQRIGSQWLARAPDCGRQRGTKT